MPHVSIENGKVVAVYENPQPGISEWREDSDPLVVAFFNPPTTAAAYGRAIQAYVDATARAREYNDGVTCASYIASTIPGWAADAAAFVSWRDLVWDYAYTQLRLVQAGQRAQPTVAELIAELPTISWPS